MAYNTIEKRRMFEMNAKFGFFVAAFLFAGFVLDADAKTTYRDAQGRIQGSKKD
jgi:hypothetical protein